MIIILHDKKTSEFAKKNINIIIIVILAIVVIVETIIIASGFSECARATAFLPFRFAFDVTEHEFST